MPGMIHHTPIVPYEPVLVLVLVLTRVRDIGVFRHISGTDNANTQGR